MGGDTGNGDDGKILVMRVVMVVMVISVMIWW